MIAKYVATTPASISNDIRSFCAEIEPHVEPVYIESIRYEAATMGQCYANVTDYCQIFGGERQFGWIIWILDGIYITAEHHAVVKLDNGSLLDITPQIGNEKQILFLPSSRNWTRPRPIGNYYRPVKDTPLLNRLCTLLRRNQQLFVAGMMGSREWYGNDEEAVRLIDKYYSIRTKNENRKKKRQR